EAANHPVTPEADQALRDKGVVIVPDILANSGGVIASYFEWAQNIQVQVWGVDRVSEELDRKLRAAFEAVLAAQEKYDIHSRDAAMVIGVERVFHAAQARFH
ncbi:MAG: glutamate dehydrogenase, partial [Okeania sp. SIO1H5]|nr:glutamate dehydrogenase [Okeania sp. SIO1H5]